MSEADLSMIVRENRFGWYNLAIGEPLFLHEALQPLYPKYSVVNKNAYKYPPSEGLVALREAVVREPGHHLLDFDPRNVIITAGAKQGLLAAMTGLAAANRLYNIEIRPPFWPSLPGLVRRAELDFYKSVPDYQRHLTAELITLPNNPTGVDVKFISTTGMNGVIWDAVYASPLYGDYKPITHADVVVGSFSKIYGLSGIRVGWAAFRNPAAASAASLYTETTTSGVSTVAQAYALDFLNVLNKERPFFEKLRGLAANTLMANAGVFNQYIRPFVHSVSGVPAGLGGMFAWFAPAQPEVFAKALEAARIDLVDGKHAGVPGFYRMNMGLPKDTFEAAVIALYKELERR